MAENPTQIYTKPDPIRLRVSEGVLAEAAHCEEASWEDHGRPGEKIGDAHAKVIFERGKTRLALYSPAEVERVISSLVNSADIKGDVWGSFDQECATAARHVKAFNTLIRKVRAAAEEKSAIEKKDLKSPARPDDL